VDEHRLLPTQGTFVLRTPPGSDACRTLILDWCSRNRDALHENYDSKSGKGLGAKQFGWTAAFVIEFIMNWNRLPDL
jgi:hypothetical protein